MKEDVGFVQTPSPAPMMMNAPGRQMIYDSDTEDNDMSETNSDTEDEWENVPMNQSPQIQRPMTLKPLPEDEPPLNKSPIIKPPRTPLANQLNKDQDKKDIKPIKKTTVNHASFTSGNNSSSRTNNRKYYNK